MDKAVINGTIIDPVKKTERMGTILLDGSKIAEVDYGGHIPAAKEIIDAAGCIVTPGLIDSHLHLFYGGTENGILPDLTLLPMGVTAAVDQGSSGSATFQAFYDSILSRSLMNLFATVNLSTQGLITSRYPEDLEPGHTDISRLKDLFAKYPKILKGIKLRISQEVVGKLGMKPLEKALEAAEPIGTRIVVHTTNPPIPVNQLLQYFRKDDIYTHVFAQRGYSILTDTGTLEPEVYDARKRGVVFDAADARVHYAFPVIRQALREGFLPDTISTDLVQGSCFQPGVFGLPRVLSKYVALGMSLAEVIRAVTYRAAQVLGEENRLGTLNPGTEGDIAIFKWKTGEFQMQDRLGNLLEIPRMLVLQCTILKGQVVYRQIDF